MTLQKRKRRNVVEIERPKAKTKAKSKRETEAKSKQTKVFSKANFFTQTTFGFKRNINCATFNFKGNWVLCTLIRTVRLLPF